MEQNPADYGHWIMLSEFCTVGKPTVAFRQVRGDRERCAVQLICQEAVPPWELLGQADNSIAEVHRLLVDLQILEHEWHVYPLEQ